MNKRIHAIGYVISPSQAIGLESALITAHGQTDVTCKVLIGWPGSNELTEKNEKILRHILESSPIDYQICKIPEQFIRDDSDFSLVPDLIRLLSTAPPSEILYPHDVVGNLVHLTCKAFPRARRICYGDAFGLLADREYHIGIVRNGRRFTESEEKRFTRQRLIKMLFARRKISLGQSLIPDEAIMPLPVDQSGRNLWGVPLTIPSKETVRDVIFRMSSRLENLNEWIRDINRMSASRKTYLLMLETMAEGGLVRFEDEISIYESIVRTHMRPDSQLIIKNHPGETFDKTTPLRSRLGSHYSLIEMPRELRPMPVEFCFGLDPKIQIIGLSTGILTMKYLFDRDAIHPGTDRLVKSWFDPRARDTYSNSFNLVRVPLDNLATWSGEGPLAKGPF